VCCTRAQTPIWWEHPSWNGLHLQRPATAAAVVCPAPAPAVLLPVTLPGWYSTLTASSSNAG
jgi:hypothetical protein